MTTAAAIHEDAEFRAALALLETQIEGDLATHIVPGLSASVTCGAETVWQRGFGLADLERKTPAAPDTVYAVGSITKLFTATMLMQLRDAGRLRLDDPVQDYVPDVPVPRRHPDSPAITFRHLVTHTSGLAKDSPVGYWDSVEFPPVETMLAKLAETEQPYPPGRQWKYSNLAIALLGHALARIAGQSWESWLAERILAPLSMAGTAPRLADAQRPKLARGYARPAAGWPPASLAHQELGGIGAGGSLHSTVSDMAKFIAQQFADAPKLLCRATVEEMHRPQWVNDDWQWGQGIGWRVHRAGDGSTRIEHGGGVYGFTCRVLLSVPERVGVAVFTNGSDGTVGMTVSARMLDLLVPVARRIAARRAASAAAAAPAEWQRYVGRYRWVLGDAEVVQRDGDLLLFVANGAATDTVRLQPEAEHVFRMPGGPLRGEQLRFVVDGSGPARRAWVGPHPHDRI
jgi:D-alanyl-D-alanine carboxypeptidase